MQQLLKSRDMPVSRIVWVFALNLAFMISVFSFFINTFIPTLKVLSI